MHPNLYSLNFLHKNSTGIYNLKQNTDIVYLIKVAILLFLKHRQHPYLVHCQLVQPQPFLPSSGVLSSASMTNISSSSFSWDTEFSEQLFSASSSNLSLLESSWFSEELGVLCNANSPVSLTAVSLLLYKNN